MVGNYDPATFLSLMVVLARADVCGHSTKPRISRLGGDTRTLEKMECHAFFFDVCLFTECLFECLEVDSWVGLFVWKCMGLLGFGLRVVCVFVLFLNVVTCIDASKCYRKKMTFFLHSKIGCGRCVARTSF